MPVDTSPTTSLSPAMLVWIKDLVCNTLQKLGNDSSLALPAFNVSAPAVNSSSLALPTAKLSAAAENPDINRKLSVMLASAWSASIRKVYDGSVRRFTAYCANHRWDLSSSTPANELTLCLYIHSLAGSHSSSYICNEISGIRAFHIINNLKFDDSEHLCYLLKVADNLQPANQHRPLHLATSANMLRQLRVSLDMASPFDSCCFAAATCAFWGQARLGELLAITLTGDASHLPTLVDLKEPTMNARLRTLFLPRTKTTGNASASIYLCHQAEDVDTVSSLENYTTLNRPDISPLFSFQRNGSLQRLTKSHFLLRIRGVLDSAGFGRISGHSFRIGGTTELLLNDVDPTVVQVMGRWSSDSFLRYWHSVEVLAPLHAELLHSRKRAR